MYFNEYFDVEVEKMNNYGALNISLDNDLPLFIDPMLLFVSENEEFHTWHTKLVKYIIFLASLKHNNESFSESIINTYFTFKEVCNNWLGLAKKGNKGSAIGHFYGESLYNYINSVIDTHNISKSIHFEKLCLLQEGIGKDKISDFVVNILLAEFAQYTERFAKLNIKKEKLHVFRLEKGHFDFKINRFIPKKYLLPFIIDEKGKKEFVLLTPKEIVRFDENTINKEDFYNSFDDVLGCISNEELRTNISLHLNNTIKALYDAKKRVNKIPTDRELKEQKRKAIDEVVSVNPEILDYFIKKQEESRKLIQEKTSVEIKRIESIYYTSAKALSANYFKVIKEHKTAFDEALYRINFIKNEIEECGLWKNLYIGDIPIVHEEELQRLFRIVWCRTNYDFNSEVNNGNGPVDFKASRGFNNKVIIEFKLASNSKLKHVFAQTNAYEKSNKTNNTIIVIFYFNDIESKKVQELIANYKGNKKIISIDCRKDNKKSASVRKQSE